MQVRVLPGVRLYPPNAGCMFKHMKLKPFFVLLLASSTVGCMGYPVGSHKLTSPALIQENHQVHLTAPGIVIENDGPARKNSDNTEVELDLVDVSCIVRFAFDSAVLSPEMKQNVDQVVEFLVLNNAKHPHPLQVVIEGHASSEGPKPYNLKLSQRRAQAVNDYLTAALHKAGLTTVSVIVKGLGAPAPTIQNSTPEVREHDRNAEFVITLVSAPQ